MVRLVQTWVSQNHVLLWIGYLIVAAVVGLALYRFTRTPTAKALGQTLHNEVLTNWRLTLLGVTSLSLALASGWTTWDGMTNFTGTPLLSFLITLGIQGVMLIAAWLIGESFAIGLADNSNGARRSLPDMVLAALAILLLAATIYALAMLATSQTAQSVLYTAMRRHKSNFEIAMPIGSLRILIALGVSATITLLLVTQKEVFEPYFRGIKTVLKSLPLWLMFLACMATSVFFSFDSLFSTIFPADERARAAQLRTTNQVAGIVSDLGTTIAKRQADGIDGLFTSAQWAEYNARINDIIAIARSAPDQLAELARKELESLQSQRAAQVERKASAESQQAGLDKRKEELLADVAKLKEEVPPLAAEVDKLKSDSFAKDGEISTKKAEMQAEAGGVGGTLKAGQGPVWSQRKKELDDLTMLKTILDGQLKDRSAQLKAKRDKIAASESELAQIDGEIGNLKGQMDVADKQIAAAEAKPKDGSLSATTETIATSGFNSLEDAFAKFRQHPERAAFDAMQQQCAALLGVFDKVPNLKSAAEAKGARCDPSVVAEPVANILALNDGLAAYKTRCAKPDSLPQTGVDDLLQFAQQCVQTSGLGGADTIAFRSQINSIGLNRDDKAHRFVVSWNAFLDGNRLAYLSLLIAIALDGLVFMSGLFGANATSSPLVRLPGAAGRSPGDLESAMVAALRPDIYGTSELVLNNLRPNDRYSGFVAEIRTAGADLASADKIGRFLSAAAQFGAVKPVEGDPGTYLVRGELTEFLAKTCERELRAKPEVKDAADRESKAAVIRREELKKEAQHQLEQERKDSAGEVKVKRELQRKAAALEQPLIAALVPDNIEDTEALFHRSSFVLAQMRPTAENYEFTSEIDLAAVLADSESKFLRSVLNVAAAHRAVQKDRNSPGEVYLLRPELVQCFADIRVKAFKLAEDKRAEVLRRASRPRIFAWPRGRENTPVRDDRDGQEPAIARIAGVAAGAKMPVPALASPGLIDTVSLKSDRLRAPQQLRNYTNELGGHSAAFNVNERDALLAITQRHWAAAIDARLKSLDRIADIGDVLAATAESAGVELARFHEMVQRRKIDVTGVETGEAAAAYVVLRKLTALAGRLGRGTTGPSSAVPMVAPQASRELQQAIGLFIAKDDKQLDLLTAALDDFADHLGGRQDRVAGA